MIHKSGKSYPYPVLRDGSEESDYPNRSFDICNLEDEPMFRASEDGSGVKIFIKLAMNSEDLQNLISEGKAEYGLLVASTKTYYRSWVRSSSGIFDFEVEPGSLKGRVTMSPFLFAVETVQGCRFGEWHADYAGLPYSFPEGAVLAETEPAVYQAEDPEEDEISSIFEVGISNNVPNGQWKAEPAGDKIKVLFGSTLYEKYQEAKKRLDSHSEWDMLAALFQPVLIDVFYIVKTEAEEKSYENFRWYDIINNKLAKASLPLLDEPANVSSDVQTILDNCFGKLSYLGKL